MKRKWKEQSVTEKILTVARPTVSLVILCAGILKYLNLWPKALNLAIPLFAVYYLLETVDSWNRDRDIAAIYLFSALILTALSCVVFFL